MASPTGIRKRHARSCSTGRDDGCDCKPTYEASVWDRRTNTKRRKTFPTLAAARGWRTDVGNALHRGKLAVQSRETVAQAAARWLEQAKSGETRQPSGARYKPSVLRMYESDLRRFIVPALGHLRLSELRRRDVQELVDELVGRGLSGSRVRGIVMPLRSICRRAIRNDELSVNPTAELDLPAADGVRDRVASVPEAEALLAALPGADRPLWATAVYAGLRRGELRALRWADIDDDVTVISVKRSWDEREGEIDPKTAKGTRTVPIVTPLRLLLLEHKAATGRRDDDLVFGASPSRPFTPTNIRKRALRAWALVFTCGCKRERPRRQPQWARNATRVEAEKPPVCPVHEAPLLTPIGLHECRHTFVSLMHDAGFSLERIGDYVGHSSAYMTDRYRHLIEGHEGEAAAQFDAYLTKRTGARTGAQAQVVALQPHG